jgi:hypothetical protein
LIKSAHLWHRRLGHISLKLLKKTSKIGANIPNFDAVKESDFRCLACDKGKSIRRLSSNPIPDPPAVLDSIEGDTFKISPRPYNGCSIGLFLIDRKSRYRWLFLLKDREGDTVSKVIKSFFKLLKTQYDRYPKKFHYDGGTEINTELKEWLARKGVLFSDSAPYIHEQNGLIERSIRVLLDRLRATMISSELPLYLWCFIIPAVLEIINRTAVSNRDLSPYQEFFDDIEPSVEHIPDLGRYRAIGSPCEVLIPLEKRAKSQKLVPRTESARLLAVIGSKMYLVYIPQRHVVLKTSFIKLYEDSYSDVSDSIGLEGVISEGNPVAPPPSRGGPLPPPSSPTPGPSDLLKPSIITREPLGPLEPINTTSGSKELSLPPEGVSKDSFGEDIEMEDISNSVQVEQVSYLVNMMKTSHRESIFSSLSASEPRTYKQVLNCPEKSKWLEVIYAEFDQIVQKGVLKFISKAALPKGRRVVTTRLVLAKKTQPKIKYKARLVARGFQQVEGLDYTETFASTSIPPTWRVLLAIAAVKDWEIEQIDFIGAFLNSDLDEDVYIEIPEGFLEYTKLIEAKTLKKMGFNPKEDQIIHLQKALYGLKQAPRQWQTKVSALLLKEGFKPLISDSAVFFNKKLMIFVVTYVDDCLIIGPSLATINSLKARLNTVYAIDDLGPASLFLGVQILRDRAKRLLWLSQSHYVEEALKTFNMLEAKIASLPLQPGVVGSVASANSSVSSSEILSKADHKLYRRIVGTVMYLMVQTRVDIGFSVQWLSTKLEEPTIANLSSSKSLLRYLKGSKELSICYGRSKDLIPQGFSDSDYAGDKVTAKSTYGYLMKVAGGPVSWKAKKGSTVSLSTLEAEFTALMEATREIEWLSGLFWEIQRPFIVPIILHGDHQGANTTAYNPILHARTKHTLVRFQYVKEKVKEGLITVVYLETSKMPADGLTKALTLQKYKNFIVLLGLENPVIKAL